MNKHTTPKVLIAGAGPAGIAASLILTQHKIAHVIADKADFPRDKICGDALSGKVVDALNKIDKTLLPKLTGDPQFTGSYGVSFFAPNGNRLDVPFSMHPENLKHAPGFLSKRFHFDNFLFHQLNPDYAEIRTGTAITKAVALENEIEVSFTFGEKKYAEKFSLVIAAEGDRSVIRKSLTTYQKDNAHYCAGIRAYYSNVTKTHPQHFIELHFIKELLPGYLWVFPMQDGTANVGIGMPSATISAKHVDLKETLTELLKTHPALKERFENAKIEDAVKGWGLPIGSKKYPISGNNFLLTGDAASLIDPFTGEGIGNAMLSGIQAARKAVDAVRENNFSASYLKSYDDDLYKRIWPELQLSRTMQKLSSYPALFNFVVNKSLKSQTLRETITCMFEDIDLRKRFSSPAFYLKMLFNK